MSAAGEPKPTGGKQDSGVKIDDSALEWLASQSGGQEKAANTPPQQKSGTASAPAAPSGPQTPAPATQPIPTRIPLTREQREAIRVAAAELVKAAGAIGCLTGVVRRDLVV